MTRISEIPEAIEMKTAFTEVERMRLEVSDITAKSVIWGLMEKARLKAKQELSLLLSGVGEKDVELDSLPEDTQRQLRQTLSLITSDVKDAYNDVMRLVGRKPVFMDFRSES
jgi:predicted secreted protein